MKTQHSLFGMPAGVVFAASALALATSPAWASTITLHNASSYGAQVNVGSTLKVGPVAPATLPTCDAQAVGSFQASAASISDAPLLGTGVVDNVASSTATTSTGTSDVLGVNLLGGLITASELKSVSTTSVDSSGVFHFSSAGSVFSGLSVLGIPVGANPAPNTTIDLPGIGSVVLNEQITSTASGQAAFTVNVVHVRVSIQNLLGFAVGTEVIVADTSSQLQSVAGVAAVGGYAQAISLVTGPVTSGPLVRVLIPCTGTGGALKNDYIASTSLPEVLSTGSIEVTGTGNTNGPEASSSSAIIIQSLNLLSGVLSASAINSTANAVTTNGTSFDLTGGTTFGQLSVAGHPEITVSVPVNTQVNLAGLGTLYLNRVQTFKDAVKVRPIELIVNTANSLGLPVGADLIIGTAQAELHSAAIP